MAENTITHTRHDTKQRTDNERKIGLLNIFPLITSQHCC